LIAYGREYELRELLDVVLQDEDFFKNGQGGVTLSGGECLAQSDFVIAFAKALYDRGISVNIDTCGFVKREIFEEILPYVDTFLYDIKAYDSELHERLTGRNNGLILDNLRYLSDCGAKIEIRYPLVAGVNDGECEKIAKLLATQNITKVKVLRYHSFAGSRYEALGRENTMPKVSTENEDIKKAIKVFEKPTFPSLDMANFLKDKEYDEVELCGLVSNICVLTNAVMVKASLPNAKIIIDAKATDSFDKTLQEKCFDVLEGIHIQVINR
jgi:pyruvate-formate lyase-activating enzyme